MRCGSMGREGRDEMEGDHPGYQRYGSCSGLALRDEMRRALHAESEWT